MKNNDDSANEADGTAQLTQGPKLFLQEIGSQDGTDKYTECTKRRNENSRCEGVCGKITDLSNTHWVTTSALYLGSLARRAKRTGRNASPPQGVLHVDEPFSFESVSFLDLI